jgi:hypothetical protein
MRDGHENDFIDKSMKKNAILSKLETKKRGIENIDSMEADKYFIDKKNGEDKVVGRARPKDKDGNELSFFPDYIVIPKGEIQYNFAEGIKAINQMLDWGIKVEVTTEDVEYDGKTIPKGSYVLSMYQSNRNVIFEVMSKGYDATGFASMYADIYCNLPDVRGFDSVQVYGKGLFDGKTKAQEGNIRKKFDIKGSVDKYVTFKSQSTDAVRAVNGLFKQGADVWMLKTNVEGVGAASDYVILAQDLNKIKNIVDDPTIGQKGIQLDGKYLDKLPDAAVKLVEPVINFNTTRTEQSGGTLWYLLDEYLGFGSLVDYDGGNSLRDGANVIIANNVNSNGFQNSWVNAIKNGDAGVIFIRNAAGLGKLGVTAPTSTNTFQDVAINGTYNVDDSLFTTNYATTETYYARGYAYSNLPKGSRVLFRSLENGEDAFIGGFQATKGEKETFGNKTTIFSTTLDGDDFAKPVSAVVFGQQMDYRSHYQKLLPMLATAIYAAAAGIVDDVAAPDIEMNVDDDEYVLSVTDGDKGLGMKSVKAYRIKGADEVQIFEGDGSEDFSFTNDSKEDWTLKVVAEDNYGNVSTRTFQYSAATGGLTSDAPADDVRDMIKTLDENSTPADIQAAQAAYNKLSGKDKAKVDMALGEGGAIAAIMKADQAVADKAVATAVAAQINALGNNPTEAAVAAAKAAYNGLTAAQKAQVDAAVGGDGAAAALNKAEKKVEKSKEEARKANNNAKVAAAKQKTVKGLKVTSKSKKATVSWNKTKGATAYQVQYKNKKAKKWSNLTKSTKKTKVVSKKLKKGKTTFRVRTITRVNGKNVYGKWATKIIKIKSKKK